MMRNAHGATSANIRKGMLSHSPRRRKGIFGACAAAQNVVVFAAMKRIMHQLPAPIRSLLQERSGQAMIEYVVCAAVLVMLTGLLALLLVTVRESGGRVLDLVASEYP